MKILLVVFSVVLLLGCFDKRHKFDSEELVFRRFEKKYDSLRTSLKDSLHSSIRNVNDFNQLYTISEKIQLDSIISDFERKSGLKLALITFDSTMTSKDSVEEVTRIIGIKNRINTTIGISVSHRIMYIWNDSLVNNTLFDEYSTKSIIDNYFTPSFGKGEYYNGTIQGVNKIIQTAFIKLKSQKSIKKNGS